MAHELDTTNDRANMAYVGDLPWHGLGQKLTEDADLEVWKKEAGMNWMVGQVPLEYEALGEKHVFPERHVLFRSDNGAGLGIVSDKYKIVHPGEILEFFRSLIEAHGFKMETAGCLFGGRKFWALARVGKEARIMGQDTISPYLLMASSCDGSMATVAHLTTVRVVCQNTLRMSIGTNGQKATLKVPHHAIFSADTVKNDLGLVENSWDQFLTSANLLARLKLDREVAIQVVADALKAEWSTTAGDPMTHDEMMSSSSVLRRIITLYDGAGKGATYRSSKNTGWGLVNAVTEYFDHESGTGTNKSRAFERAHLTDRSHFKVKIADRLLEIAA